MPSFKQLLTWGAVALVVWFIIVEPVTAAHVVKGIGHGLSAFAHGVATFVAAL